MSLSSGQNRPIVTLGKAVSEPERADGFSRVERGQTSGPGLRYSIIVLGSGR